MIWDGRGVIRASIHVTDHVTVVVAHPATDHEPYEGALDSDVMAVVRDLM